MSQVTSFSSQEIGREYTCEISKLLLYLVLIQYVSNKCWVASNLGGGERRVWYLGSSIFKGQIDPLIAYSCFTVNIIYFLKSCSLRVLDAYRISSCCDLLYYLVLSRFKTHIFTKWSFMWSRCSMSWLSVSYVKWMVQQLLPRSGQLTCVFFLIG